MILFLLLPRKRTILIWWWTFSIVDNCWIHWEDKILYWNQVHIDGLFHWMSIFIHRLAWHVHRASLHNDDMRADRVNLCLCLREDSSLVKWSPAKKTSSCRRTITYMLVPTLPTDSHPWEFWKWDLQTFRNSIPFHFSFFTTDKETMEWYLLLSGCVVRTR